MFIKSLFSVCIIYHHHKFSIHSLLLFEWIEQIILNLFEFCVMKIVWKVCLVYLCWMLLLFGCILCVHLFSGLFYVLADCNSHLYFLNKTWIEWTENSCIRFCLRAHRSLSINKLPDAEFSVCVYCVFFLCLLLSFWVRVDAMCNAIQ